nr:sulfatase/phosphatase domain-containing protein [Haliscomenobacter sp.]
MVVLREGKGTSFEGGLRVPCIMRWKGRVPAGVICNQLSSTIDILPTLADLCQLKLPEHKIDGFSMLPVLNGNTEYEVRKNFYYYYYRNDLQAVRSGHWKLILPHKGRSYLNQLPGENGFPGASPEDTVFPMGLYDLRRDPGEAYDVQKKYPEVVEELLKLAEAARADLGDNLTKRVGANVRVSGMLE